MAQQHTKAALIVAGRDAFSDVFMRLRDGGGRESRLSWSRLLGDQLLIVIRLIERLLFGGRLSRAEHRFGRLGSLRDNDFIVAERSLGQRKRRSARHDFAASPGPA